jgi:hypothetical protein
MTPVMGMKRGIPAIHYVEGAIQTTMATGGKMIRSNDIARPKNICKIQRLPFQKNTSVLILLMKSKIYVLECDLPDFCESRGKSRPQLQQLSIHKNRQHQLLGTLQLYPQKPHKSHCKVLVIPNIINLLSKMMDLYARQKTWPTLKLAQ